MQLELLNGIQTIKAVREIELGAERVPAHIVGTSSDHDVATNMILAGADEFLEKPFELKSIKQIVSRC